MHQVPAPERAIRRRMISSVLGLLASSAVTLAISFSPGLGATGWVPGSGASSFLRGSAVTLLLVVLGQSWFVNRPLLRCSRELQRQVSRYSRNDALTGCLNRHGFEEESLRLVARVRRYPEPLAILLLDVDGLRQINRRHGREIGDQVLAAVGKLLLRSIREVDAAAHLDGGEFVALLPESGRVAAMLVAQRLRRSVAGERFLIGGDELSGVQVSISIGVAVLVNTDAGWEETWARAEQALLLAKTNGRNRVESEPRVSGETNNQLSLPDSAPAQQGSAQSDSCSPRGVLPAGSGVLSESLGDSPKGKSVSL